jgi:hypothetical protein
VLDNPENYAPVTMVVVNGIVMKPTHCAFLKCEDFLNNTRSEFFCTAYKLKYRDHYCIVDCYS